MPTQDTWNPRFVLQHPAYWPIESFAGQFVRSHTHWPDLSDYQRFLEQLRGTMYSANNKPLKFVAQGGKPRRFEDGYEPRIFLRGEIQTRLHNWHDFFQVMAWRMFPKTKVLLNKLHYQTMLGRHEQSPGQTRRSARENMLTQFDECGAVVLASDDALLAMIRDFQWKSLFWQHRDSLRRRLKCIVFGHAIYEKLLQPYVGMTAHSILINVPQHLLELSSETIINETDKLLAKVFARPDDERGNVASPQDLSPFPLLGLPGWADNATEAFYDNTRYFRPGRHQK